MFDLRATALHDFRFLARIVGGPARPVSLGPARPDEGDDLLCLQDLRVPYEGDQAPGRYNQEQLAHARAHNLLDRYVVVERVDC